jgi:hypothetical protein
MGNNCNDAELKCGAVLGDISDPFAAAMCEQRYESLAIAMREAEERVAVERYERYGGDLEMHAKRTQAEMEDDIQNPMARRLTRSWHYASLSQEPPLLRYYFGIPQQPTTAAPAVAAGTERYSLSQGETRISKGKGKEIEVGSETDRIEYGEGMRSTKEGTLSK